eukprot:TRINITY_DN123048_c0_g1_i1.p1 TRINITY_DN123048_c0_g1~~TRINITY_DN123048_c0_g1_i1.p1  ORF type:complete len:262 (+),score=34.68 TRINITY_DN123048_c0_g1_i1:94-879(+)
MRASLILLAVFSVALAGSRQEGDWEETCLLQAAVRMLPVVRANARSNESLRPVSDRLGDANERTNESLWPRSAYLQDPQPVTDAHSHMGALRFDLKTDDSQKALAEASRTCKLLLFICVAYGGAALVYEVSAGADGGKQEAARILHWDAARLLVNVAIVIHHMNQTWQVALAGDAVLLFYPMTFSMTSFAFMSGVFGQRVDKSSLSRVLCYTYGTYYAISLLARSIHSALGVVDVEAVLAVLWYLIVLVYWRFTLSPLFCS